jgi:hypothetical protein
VLGRPRAGLLDHAPEPERAAAAPHTIGLGWEDLSAALAQGPDLAVNLTPQPGLELSDLGTAGVPVLDACGATRSERLPTVELL